MLTREGSVGAVCCDPGILETLPHYFILRSNSMVTISWFVLTTPIILFLLFLLVVNFGQYDPYFNWLTENDTIGNVLLLAVFIGLLMGAIMLILA